VTEEERRMLDTAPDESMVCKICHRALAFIKAKDGSESWEHFAQDSLVGHKAVPVNAKTGKLLGRCDFCNTDLETEIWFLPVSEFLAGIDPRTGRMQAYKDDWAACPDCAPLIDANQWSALARRTQTVWEAAHAVPAPQDRITGWRHLQRLVRRNISGSLYRVE
jgi:hypothetical protein